MIKLEALPPYEPAPMAVCAPRAPVDENQLRLPLRVKTQAYTTPDVDMRVDELTCARITRLLRAILEAGAGRRSLDALDKHLNASTRRKLRSTPPLPVLRHATISKTHCTRIGARYEAVAIVVAQPMNRTFAMSAALTDRGGNLKITAFEMLLTKDARNYGLPVHRSTEGPRTNLARR